MQRNLSLRQKSSIFATSLIRGRLASSLFQRFPLKGKAFPFRPRSGHLTYSLFSIIYSLLSNSPLAPSDEGAVNEVDWGREPDFVFPQRSKNHADDPVYQIPTPVLLREDYVN